MSVELNEPDGVPAVEVKPPMRASFWVGRIAGIDVYLHPTVILFVVIMAWAGHGWRSAVLALAILGCVFLHELGHALAGAVLGIGTKEITMYPLGGLTYQVLADGAVMRETLIALAGPLASLAVAGVLYGCDLATQSVGLGDSPILLQLAWINLAIALLNLVPVAPLDGGRVLRAVLSARDSRLRAVQITVTMGRTLYFFAALAILIVGPLGGVEYWPVYLAIVVFLLFEAGAQRSMAHYLAEIEAQRHSHEHEPAPAGYLWMSVGEGESRLVPKARLAYQFAHRMYYPWL